MLHTFGPSWSRGVDASHLIFSALMIRLILLNSFYLNWQHLLGPMFCKTLNVFDDQTMYFSKQHFRSFNVTVTVML